MVGEVLEVVQCRGTLTNIQDGGGDMGVFVLSPVAQLAIRYLDTLVINPVFFCNFCDSLLYRFDRLFFVYL